MVCDRIVHINSFSNVDNKNGMMITPSAIGELEIEYSSLLPFVY